ncbi:MAG: SH3 domain-containing protein [Ardenticatenia bacterium]|nr:SH3 domain-containing protein [Ardenticatenia bacterium]
MEAFLRRAWDQFKRQGMLGKAIILLVIASLPIRCCGGLAGLIGGPSTPTTVAQAPRWSPTAPNIAATKTVIAFATFASLTAEAPTATPILAPSPSATVAPIPTPTPQPAELTCTVQAGPLNIRKGPGTNQTVLSRLSQGESITVIAYAEDDQWARLRLASGGEGWVSTRYIECQGLAVPTTSTAETTAQPDVPKATATPMAIGQENTVNVRDGPGTDYPRLGQVTKNTRLRITGKNLAGDWLQVCCVNDQQVWIAGWLVQVEGDASDVQAIRVPPPPPTPIPTATPTQSPSAYMPEPTRPAAIPTPITQPPRRSCCKICTTGKACGNSCIARWKTCHQPPGCACNG